LIVCWRLYYVWQNKRRDKKAAESGISKEEQERLGRELGETDTTDLQNPHFRYSL
jgi:ACS family allantoate permease-like MFS transporter